MIPYVKNNNRKTKRHLSSIQFLFGVEAKNRGRKSLPLEPVL